MDKETLSNYGWIVIAVLVLAVMIALATPFGDYISSAVKSTTAGLFATNQKALNQTGLINIADQDFNNNNSTETKRNGIIPDGAIYTKADGTTLEGNGTNTFPDTPATNDTYEYGDYKYTYGSYGTEWSVKVKDTSKTSYGEILSEIAGKPVTGMYRTFENCTSLTTAPKIPNSVTDMLFTFANCSNLTTAPEIPNSVIRMNYTFRGCTSLTTAPVIPNSVTNMAFTFFDCTSLTTAPDMSKANNVRSMSSTFMGCTFLTGTIEINANPTSYKFCFDGTKKPIMLTGTSTMLAEIAENRSNVTVQ